VWVLATNPAASMPDSARVARALERAQLVIVQDAYHPTEATRFADVLLPAAQWPEKDGVMTNSERRITNLPKLVEPPGEAWPDAVILTRFAHEMARRGRSRTRARRWSSTSSPRSRGAPAAICPA
jgi:ferredoxin-nitrate reductase